MRFRLLCSGVLLAVVSAIGAADGPPFGFPLGPTPPAPAPAPGGVLQLNGESLLVVQFKTDTVLRAKPPGLVKLTKETGPLRIRARFADGNGVETRSYAGPCVFIVEASGKGRVYLDAVPLGLKAEADITSTVVDVDSGKAPQPPPDDGKVTPAPTTPVAWVVCVEETSQRTADTAKVLGDLAYWQSLTKRTPAVEWRLYDKDSPDAKQRNFDTFGAEIGLPAVLFLAADGKKLAGFKLPKSTADIDAKLKEFNK